MTRARGDAVDLDVKFPGPVGDRDKDPGRERDLEVPAVHLVDRRKMLDRVAVDAALQNVLQRRAGGLETDVAVTPTAEVGALKRSR